MVSLVWLAGPLSGMIVQPVVGALSDASTSKWGRRRPYMAAGAASIAASLLVFAFAREIGAAFGDEPGKRPAGWPLRSSPSASSTAPSACYRGPCAPYSPMWSRRGS